MEINRATGVKGQARGASNRAGIIMSNHLFQLLSGWLSALSHKSSTITSNDRMVNAISLGIMGLGHAIYARGTEKEEVIHVAHTYQMVRTGRTEFMVVDQRGRHFNVNNSLWYWKWDAVEEWSQIQKGETRRVRMYGWRLPVWGMFPNIIGIEKKGEAEE